MKRAYTLTSNIILSFVVLILYVSRIFHKTFMVINHALHRGSIGSISSLSWFITLRSQVTNIRCTLWCPKLAFSHFKFTLSINCYLGINLILFCQLNAACIHTPFTARIVYPEKSSSFGTCKRRQQ